MKVNRQWVLKERPQGVIGEQHFEYREAEVPEIFEGEVLIQNLSLSFD